MVVGDHPWPCHDRAWPSVVIRGNSLVNHGHVVVTKWNAMGVGGNAWVPG